MEEDKKKDSCLLEIEITLSNIVAAPFRSPLNNLFFSNPSLLILPNLISFNTSTPFL